MAGGTFAALSGVSGVHATSAVCWIRPHVGNIAVSEASAHSQHGAHPLQKNIAALDRHRARRVDHDSKLRTAARNLPIIGDLRWRPTSTFTSATRKVRSSAGRMKTPMVC